MLKRVGAMSPFQVAVANLKVGNSVRLRDQKTNQVFIIDRLEERHWLVGIGDRYLSQEFHSWPEVCSFLPDNLAFD